ncbi:MAG: hypothetical protein APF80_12015 [Alphaproteobacteria bacterium BRH_c36]|nr:MAG: hypothetical protein APF80_12015 [Alphaproteobacteria bacterium BRH_c36]
MVRAAVATFLRDPMSRFQSIHYLVHSAVAFICYVALTQLESVDRFIANTPIIQEYPFLQLSVRRRAANSLKTGNAADFTPSAAASDSSSTACRRPTPNG